MRLPRADMRKRPVVIVLLLVALVLGFVLGRLGGGPERGPAPAEHGHPSMRASEEVPRRLSMSEEAVHLARIVTAAVVRSPASAQIRLTGKVAVDQTRTEMIAARIGGRIDKLYVDYVGMPVNRGDALGLIYSPELVSLQKELLQAARAARRHDQRSADDRLAYTIDQSFAAAKEKLRLLGFSQAQLQEIIDRDTTRDHMILQANQQGTVVKELVEEGGYVTTGTPLFQISDLSRVWLKLDAHESDILWLRLGQKARFRVKAWPGERFTATISFIDPLIDPLTRTAKVRLVAGNADRKLKPDMFVEAFVEARLARDGTVRAPRIEGTWICPRHPGGVREGRKACGEPLVRARELGYITGGSGGGNPLLVPSTAPLFTGKRAVVYVKVPDMRMPTFEGREVILGPQTDGHYVVKQGLSEGDSVVVNGAFKIDGELQIRARPSMMNPEGGAMGMGHMHGG